jgi:HAD superfamily hydrolase (TIGR01509 family)
MPPSLASWRDHIDAAACDAWHVVIEAVVFDLDGVLIDSEPVWEDVRRRFVAGAGGTWMADTQQRLMGMSTVEWSGYLAGEVGVPMAPDRVAAEVIAAMVKRYEDDLPLIPGGVEAVRRVGARRPLGLASSSPRQLIDAVLERAGLAGAFAVTTSTEEVPRGKPSPDVYLAVAAELRLPPGSCAAVEDSSNGIRSAVAAGMPTVAIMRSEYPVSPVVLTSAALVLDSIEALTAEALDGLG